MTTFSLEHEESETRIDLENTKKRLFETTNYSVLISIGLLSATKLFADDNIAQPPFSYVVFWALLVNAVAATIAWFSSIWSTTRFRFRLKRTRQAQGKTADAVLKKSLRDIPLWTILLSITYIAVGFAMLYLARRCEVDLSSLLSR